MHVAITFPELGFTSDLMLYEGPMHHGALDFRDVRLIEQGGLELRHCVREASGHLVTTVLPEPGAVEIRAAVESGVPERFLTPELTNICWKIRGAFGEAAPGGTPFVSSPDEPLPAVIERYFMFTTNGRTFLHQTRRRPIFHMAPEDPRNNPIPWIQLYQNANGQPHGHVDCRLDDPGDYRAYPFEFQHDWPSPDRFTIPVVGAVSIDGRYMTAMASGSSEFMFNGWGCWHNGANWEPSSGRAETRSWRVKIYLLENDVDALLGKVACDFPGALDAA